MEMPNTKKVLAGLVLAAWAASPVLAEVEFTPVDVMSVTCGDFMALETPEKNDVAYHIERWIHDAANAVEAQKLIAKYPPRTAPADLTIDIEGHCKDGAAGDSVVARLIEHT